MSGSSEVLTMLHVRRLLVACAGAPDPVLQTVLEELQGALPEVAIALLVAEPVSLPLKPFLYDSAWQDAERTRILIQELRSAQLDAALILTAYSQSPYPLAYLCYLAGVPIRIGRSQEFGGGVLTTAISPSEDSSRHPYLDLVLALPSQCNH